MTTFEAAGNGRSQPVSGKYYFRQNKQQASPYCLAKSKFRLHHPKSKPYLLWSLAWKL
jgi:hypothetical protein